MKTMHLKQSSKFRDRAHLPSWMGHIRGFWRARSLAEQFATCAALVLLPAMLVIGLWVSSRIKLGVTQSAATAAALYMENFVEPYIQELATRETLTPESLEKLRSILTETSLGQNVVSFKIWQRDGLIVASNRSELIGNRFVPSSGLRQAWSGKASVTFDELHDAENAFERSLKTPLLEVYFPLRARGTDRIIAVGEFYERADAVKAELSRARGLSWLVVAAVSFSMLTGLFAIVRRGSATIENQQAALAQRIDELTELLNENRQLRERVQAASIRASQNNENYLRRLGADLHDGPAQLISLALLRMNSQTPAPQAAAGEQRHSEGLMPFCLRSVLTDALKDIRNISAGFAVPELDVMSLRQVLRAVVERHERITQTSVAFSCPALPPDVSEGVKLAAYRLVQEGLSNAFRHAGGAGQAVRLELEGHQLMIAVADTGAGMPSSDTLHGGALGLRGLSDRIESLGGTFEIASQPGAGTSLTARIPIHIG